jgi:drug/metabolite transporter (DMT)-like permease
MERAGGGLSESSVSAADEARKAAARRRAILMMFGCTLLGAAGQILMKLGADTLGPSNSPLVMLLTPSIFFGYVLYGLMTVLFIFALRGEELSILYPIISLTYVWVAGLSVVMFKEPLNALRLAGVLTIVLGVTVLGRKKS